MILESINDVLTWLVGEKEILKCSLKAKQITQKQFDDGMMKAIQRCTKEILRIKS